MRVVWAAFAALNVGSTHVGSAHWGWAVFFGLLAVRPHARKLEAS